MIAKSLDAPPIVTKTSLAGITVADDGTYEVQVNAGEMGRDNFPDREYWYALRIIEGGTGARFPLMYGKLELNDLPFATTTL